MLHTCPDCGKEYSTKAKICPNCGRPNDAFLESAGSWIKKENARLACDMNVEDAKHRLRVSLLCLIVVFIASYAVIHLSGLHEEIHDFRTLILLYMGIIVSVFYAGIIFPFTGFRWIRTAITYVVMLSIMVFLLGTIPDFLATIIFLVWFFFPLYLMFIRPVISLIRIGWNKAKKGSIKTTLEDQYIQKMNDANQL